MPLVRWEAESQVEGEKVLDTFRGLGLELIMVGIWHLNPDQIPEGFKHPQDLIAWLVLSIFYKLSTWWVGLRDNGQEL